MSAQSAQQSGSAVSAGSPNPSSGGGGGGGGDNCIKKYFNSPYVCFCECLHIKDVMLWVVIGFIIGTCCFGGYGGGFGFSSEYRIYVGLSYLAEFFLSVAVTVLICCSYWGKIPNMVKWAHLCQVILIVVTIVVIAITILEIILLSIDLGSFYNPVGDIIICIICGAIMVIEDLWVLALIRKYRQYWYPHPLPFLLLLHTTFLFFFFAQKFISALTDRLSHLHTVLINNRKIEMNKHLFKIGVFILLVLL